METLVTWAKRLKQQIYTLYYAYKDQRVPWYAKVFTAFVVAYAFSPIDLIPDFIPVLGFLDEVILLPLGIRLALLMIPEHVKTEAEWKAAEKMSEGKPKNWIVGTVILIGWGVFLFWILNTLSS
ncbi:DUF1232 domain-containing protein [Salinibacillus xinjiangensis]|uniref:DUF1232 domain-containing protein n=2 Tax=Salinibacillus xinjiangensis TaxID=1229268 RepID=A0A6G1X8H8_9BACI|nr:DUF1232 domain-containing protein [Salinibacillus xinjiangensis]